MLGLARATHSIAFMCHEGIGLRKDTKLARKLFLEAAFHGIAISQLQLGMLCEVGKDFPNAFSWYQSAAVLGDPDAQFAIGRMYLEGLGVEKSRQNALYWFSISADAGNAKALCALADLYIDGAKSDIPIDHILQGLHKAWDSEYAPAALAIGKIYVSGMHAKPAPEEASKWFRRAGEHGQAEGWYKLGVLFRDVEAIGTPAEMKSSFARASDLGHVEATLQLADIYARTENLEDRNKAVDAYRRAYHAPAVTLAQRERANAALVALRAHP